jgi:hypothetical protein
LQRLGTQYLATYLPINETGRYSHPYVKDRQPFGCSCGNESELSIAAICIWGLEYRFSVGDGAEGTASLAGISRGMACAFPDVPTSVVIVEDEYTGDAPRVGARLTMGLS